MLAPPILFGIVFGSFFTLTGVALISVIIWRRRTVRYQRTYLNTAYARVLDAGETPAPDPLLPYPPGGADEYYRTHHATFHHHRPGVGIGVAGIGHHHHHGVGIGVGIGHHHPHHGVGMGYGMNYLTPDHMHMARDMEAMEWQRTKALAMQGPAPAYPFAISPVPLGYQGFGSAV
ncbi:hypothetical protein C8R46DRAFT_1224067 [Mycena filopes]|nr:hypothetical protein C8R46DRAFT_1224067 [Mycena filopes]